MGPHKNATPKTIQFLRFELLNNDFKRHFEHFEHWACLSKFPAIAQLTCSIAIAQPLFGQLYS